MATKVLLIGIDGLLLDRAIASGRAKNIAAIKNSSYFVKNLVDLPTVSGPSWSTYLTGKNINEHKVTDNYFVNHNLNDSPDFLTLAANSEPNLVTYAASGWPPLVDPNDVGPVIAHRQTHIDSGQHILFVRDGETHGYLKIDEEVNDHALNTLRKLGPDMSFVYFCGVDEAGHQFGALKQPYFDAIHRVDNYVGSLHEVIINRVHELKESWLLILITDHGHRDEGGHGGDSEQERSSFVIAKGIGRDNPNWPNELHPKQLVGLILNER